MYRIVKYANLLELAPTLTAILFSPSHFFRTIDSILDERKSGLKTVYKSPIGFAVRIAVFVVTTIQIPSVAIAIKHLTGYFPPLPSSPIKLQVILIFTLVLVPLVIPFICFILLMLVFIIKLIGISGYDESTQSLIMGLTRFLRIPLSCETYRDIDWKRFSWGSVYLFGYLITIPFITVILVAFALQFVLHIYPNILQPNKSLYLFIRLWSLIVLLLVAVFSRVIVYPYVALLIESQLAISDLMWKFQAWQLGVALSSYNVLLASRSKVDKRTFFSFFNRIAASEKQLFKAQTTINKEWKHFRLYLIGNIVRRRVPVKLRNAEIKRVMRVVSVKTTDVH